MIYDLSISKQFLIKINKESVTNYYEILYNLGISFYCKVKIIRNQKIFSFWAMKMVNKKLNSSTNGLKFC